VPAILLIIAFGLWLRLEARGPTPIDMSWLDLAGLDRDTVPYWIAVVLAEVGGGTGAVACTGVLAAIFALRRRFRSAGFLVTAMAAGICMSELLKAVVTRLRPIDQLYESTGFSYPSGHSMGAAALAVSLAIIAARAHGRRVRAAQAAVTQSTAAQAAVRQQPRRRPTRRRQTRTPMTTPTPYPHRGWPSTGRSCPPRPGSWR
jgi:membrane-associated phospholipid phosphatase